MKAFRTGHYFLALFFTGFLTGILIVNYIWGEQLSLIGTFTEVYLMRLKNETISFQQYTWYLIQVRGLFFLILFLMMGIRIRKIVAAFFLLWTGMSGGILLSEAVAELGMKGSILCLAGLFPQILFYVPAVLVLLRFCWNYPQNQWNRQKTFFVCGLCLIGIFSESCLNPWLIQQIVNILF